MNSSVAGPGDIVAGRHWATILTSMFMHAIPGGVLPAAESSDHFAAATGVPCQWTASMTKGCGLRVNEPYTLSTRWNFSVFSSFCCLRSPSNGNHSIVHSDLNVLLLDGGQFGTDKVLILRLADIGGR